MPVTFAPTSEVALGDEVLAIGFALDLDGDPTVTLGIVSALDRTIITDGGRPRRPDPDRRRHLVGQLGRPARRRRGPHRRHQHRGGRGATPPPRPPTSASRSRPTRSTACSTRCGTAKDGQARDEGFLGVSLDDRIDGGQGALITDVTADSPAGEAGIEDGDVVVAIDQAAIDGSAGVIAAIRDHSPGDQVQITVVRGGTEKTFDVTLTHRDGD